MRHFFTFSILLSLTQYILAQGSYKQVYQQTGPFGEKIDRYMPIVFRIYPTVNDQNHYKVYLLSDIVYDYLQFILDDSHYKSEAQFEVNFIDAKNHQVFSRTWQFQITVNNYKETNRRDKFLFTYDSLIVPAGNYNVHVNYQDLKGQQHQKFNFKIQLLPIKNFYASPPIFCDLEDNEAQYPPLFPRRPIALREYLPFNKYLGLFLTGWILQDTKVDISILFKNAESNQLIYKIDTTLSVAHSYFKVFFKLPSISWDEGNYRLFLRYYFGEDSSKQTLPVKIVWFNKPQSLQELKYAIEPLRLVMKPEDYKKLNSGNKTERRKAFFSYWKERDPTPKTALNEMMLEFYSRVDSADIKWSHNRKGRYGWKTDPGRIYVLYGKPDQIEDTSLDPVNPYMKWIYYLVDRQLIFKFKAINGRKRYQLVDEQEVKLP